MEREKVLVGLDGKGELMLLKNKKTGEMGIINYFDNQSIVIYPIDENWDAKGDKKYVYHSLAELNEEWCDYEEPKEYWFIDEFGLVQKEIEYYYEENKEAVHDKRIAVGNYFESKEEAEKAVEKLKAWKRLKEFGFRFIDWELDMKTVADGKIWFDIGINTEWDAERLLELKPEVKESLNILFGGEK